MHFNFPEGCKKYRVARKLWTEERAYKSPDAILDEFAALVSETTFSLQHLCVHYDSCRPDRRLLCGNNVAILRFAE